MPWLHYSHDVLPLLSVLSPLIGVITTVVVSRSNRTLVRPMALSNTAMTLFIVGTIAWMPNSTGRVGLEPSRSTSTAPGINWLASSAAGTDSPAISKVTGISVRICFASDGLSAWPALLLSVTIWGSICTLGRQDGHSYSLQCIGLMASQSLLLGSFFATDAIVAMFFLEAALIPIYLLLGACGDDVRRPVSSRWWIWQAIGCSSSLIGITLLAVSRPWMTSDIAARAGLTFDARVIADSIRQSLAQSETAWHLWGQLAPWAAAFLLLGLLIRLPIYPFQSWYQSSLTAAPYGTSAMIAVAFPLVALTTWLRFGLPLFGFNNSALATLLGLFSLAGALQTSFSLRAQTDLKQIVASFSSILLSIVGIGLSAQMRDGVRGAWLLVLSQAAIVATAMLIVQMVETRFGTRDLRRLSRQMTTAPQLIAVVSLLIFGWAGVPAIVAYSAIYLQLSAMTGSLWLIAGASAALAMLAWSAVSMLSQVMAANTTLAPAESNDARQSATKDLAILRSEACALLPIMALTILFSVAPTFVLGRCEPTLQKLFGRVDSQAALSLPNSPKR